MFRELDRLLDRRTTCLSILCVVSVREYFDFVQTIYEDRGNIEGQREVLKSKNARIIRKRMIDDIVSGAVLPPIVLGVVKDPYQNDESLEAVSEYIVGHPGTLSIIDGMQRTNAMHEALSTANTEQKDTLERSLIRVELWVSKTISSLVYRMLVLNTGQVPWSIRRQLEIIKKPLIATIRNSISGIYEIDEGRARSRAGEYQANRIIEMYLAFTTRSVHVDIKEQIAEDFAKRDILETTSTMLQYDIFIEVVKFMQHMDIQFSRSNRTGTQKKTSKFEYGFDLFTSDPAKIGFSAAIADRVFGYQGYNMATDHEGRWDTLKNMITEYISRLETMSIDEINDHLEIETLSDVIANVRPQKIGQWEREAFYKAFKKLIDNEFEVPNLSVCWRAMVE